MDTKFFEQRKKMRITFRKTLDAIAEVHSEK